jgi:exosortase/archaeosortase family protein
VVERESETPAEIDAPAEMAAPARGQDPWLRFALTFAALAILSEVVYYALALDSELFQSYLGAVASLSGMILEQLTDGVRVRGTVITGKLFSVEIAQGCDAYRITALLSCAIIAFPAPVSLKAWGLGLGLLWLNLLNQVRIVGLFFIGGLHIDHFQRSHEIYFPVFLICMTVLAWILWVRRATRVAFESEPDPV